MDREERKKWLKWSKVGICVPLKDKDASKKDLHMANTLERPVNLQEEMAANFKTRSIIGSIILFRQKWCKFTHFKKKRTKAKNTAKHMLKRLFMIRKRMQKFWLY